jgi:hypothetical protein
MAQQDLAGLLTGITQAPIDPMAGQSMSQRQLAMGAQAAQGLRQGMGGLFGADTRTTKEKADQMLASLDINKPEEREQIFKIISNVNPAALPALRESLAQQDAAREQKLLSQQQQQERIDLETRRADISETQGAERLEIEREKLKDSARKMTDADNKRIADAENAAGTFGNASRSATAQALRYETEKPTGGFRGTAYEGFKNFFGTQDDISAMRTAFTEVVNTNIINSLPPGVASDKDIAMAMSGFPNKDWSHTQIAQWLRGRAKLTAFAAEKEKLKSKYLNDNKGNLSGFTDMWDNLKESDGYKETVAQAYNLPGYAIPAEPVSFDQSVFDALNAKNNSRQLRGRNAPRANVGVL